MQNVTVPGVGPRARRTWCIQYRMDYARGCGQSTPKCGSKYSGARESARGLAQSKTLTRLPLLANTRSVLDCGSPLPLLFADVDDREDQANQAAEVTRIVDISHSHEARQVQNAQSGCHALPR